ncbi:MAG: hypothetical protein WD906_04465 [Anaerolineales bacterium]
MSAVPRISTSPWISASEVGVDIVARGLRQPELSIAKGGNGVAVENPSAAGGGRVTGVASRKTVGTAPGRSDDGTVGLKNSARTNVAAAAAMTRTNMAPERVRRLPARSFSRTKFERR